MYKLRHYILSCHVPQLACQKSYGFKNLVKLEVDKPISKSQQVRVFFKNHAQSSKNCDGFWRLIFKNSCSKNYEEKIKRNLVLRDFQKNMLKKIQIKNKKKCRFATKAQKLLKIKSKRASELRKSTKQVKQFKKVKQSQ